MSSSTSPSHEPFVRVRLTRFTDGTQTYPLDIVKLCIDTTDVIQCGPSSTPSTVANRKKYPLYEQKNDCIYFTTRTKPGRKVTIGVYVSVKNTNYTLTTSIEDLIRSADQTIREVNSKCKNANLWDYLFTRFSIGQHRKVVCGCPWN